MTLGERVKQIRSNQALTQFEFSKLVCISQSHLSKVENDVENPSKSALRLMSMIFDVNEEWLKTGKHD